MFAREKVAESNSVLRSLVRQNGNEVTEEMLDHITTLLITASETVPMAMSNILW